MDTILSVTVTPVVRDEKELYPNDTYNVESRDDVQFNPETGVLTIKATGFKSRISGRYHSPRVTTYPKGSYVKFSINEVEEWKR